MSRDFPTPGSPVISTNCPSAAESALPPPGENDEVLPAADKGRKNAGALPAPSAAFTSNAVESHRARHAFELVWTRVLGDEKPRDLPLNRRSDQHGAWLGFRLNARGNVGRFAEHLASGVDDNRPTFEPDASGKLRRAEGGVPRVKFAKRALNGGAARTARSASFSCA
jgi:hypothetical protein